MQRLKSKGVPIVLAPSKIRNAHSLVKICYPYLKWYHASFLPGLEASFDRGSVLYIPLRTTRLFCRVGRRVSIGIQSPYRTTRLFCRVWRRVSIGIQSPYRTTCVFCRVWRRVSIGILSPYHVARLFCRVWRHAYIGILYLFLANHIV